MVSVLIVDLHSLYYGRNVPSINKRHHIRASYLFKSQQLSMTIKLPPRLRITDRPFVKNVSYHNDRCCRLSN